MAKTNQQKLYKLNDIYQNNLDIWICREHTTKKIKSSLTIRAYIIMTYYFSNLADYVDYFSTFNVSRMRLNNFKGLDV